MARCLITVEDHDSPAIAAVWQRMHQAPDLMQRGADFVLYAVADAVVDTFFALVDWFEEVSMRSRSSSSRRSRSRCSR